MSKERLAAMFFAAMYDPYELADVGASYEELIEETERLLMDEPMTVLDYYEEARD